MTQLIRIAAAAVLAAHTPALFAAAPSADFQGRPFVTQAAPALVFERKTAPAPAGIDYPFDEQTARGAAVLSRFPPFKLSDRRIHIDGPWYSDPAANLHFTRGISSVGAMPRYREDEKSPANVRKLDPSQKWMLMIDPIWWSRATELARKLEKANPADPRLPALRAFGTGHCMTNDQEAYLELGRHTFQGERWPLDSQGRFVAYPSIDVECSQGWQFQRQCLGWLYQGMAQAARQAGVQITPMLYGQWQFSVGAVFQSSRQNGTGDPEYLRPENDFLAASDPTLKACQENNGILSMDGYQQAMWGREPFYKRNGDGSLALVNGLPVYSDLKQTTAYGCDLSLEPGEARQCLENIYRAALRMYLQHFRMAGVYPARSDLRKAFLSNCRVGAWSRYSNEGLQGIQQNDRPLPSWLLDLLCGLYLFTADDLTLWSSDMNFNPGPLGGNYTNAWRYNAHGVLESVVRAAHRYSALDPLHAAPGAYQWCWFNLPVVNNNQTPGERYFEKPIALGKLRQFEGRTWLELFAAWPALDQTPKTLKVWIDKDGRQSRAYTIQLAHGRTYFYDAWQLPEGFENLDGRHVWIRGEDLLGVTRTWRGDWREPANNIRPMPSDYR